MVLGMTQTATEALAPEVFDAAYRRVAPLVHRTPLLHSTSLSQETGFDVWLKAEVFQRTGSYKVRGPSNKLPQLSRDEQAAGVICSSAATMRRAWHTPPPASGFPPPS
jgi:threonine dehydratase